MDADDGVIDGSGLAGHSFFDADGAGGGTFIFDPIALGDLPTHVGIVWTDGYGTTTFEAFDGNGAVLATIGPVAIADADDTGQTAEDRFFGITHGGGIARIHVSNTIGGIEVDHLQYGRGGANTCLLPGVCNPAKGVCESQAKPDGAPCDDGNACTQGDFCESGACTGATSTCM